MNDLYPAHRPTLRMATAITLALALSVSGCKHTPAATEPADDATLTGAVQGKLSGDSSLASEPIQASVQQGVATLNGPVSSDAARSLAANDAAQVSGIRTVVNNLTVQPNPAASMSQSQLAAPQPAPPNHRDKLDRRDKPSASVQSAQQTPPPTPQEPFQQPAPIERQSPPVEAAHTPPILPAAAFRAITLPTDSTLPVRINTALDSATTQEGDAFSGSIASDVIVDGIVVLAQGTPVSGRVDSVHEAAHFKGSSLLTITLTNIDRRDGHLAVTTDEFSKAGNGRGKNTAEKVGGGAAIGAILGGIIGGGKGAAIGAGVGGGAGAGVQAATKGQQVQIPAETLVRFHLSSPLVVRVSTAEKSQSDASPDGDLQHHDQ